MTSRDEHPSPPVEHAVALYAAGWFPMDDVADASEPLPFYCAHERAIFELDVASREAVRRRVRRSLRAGSGWQLRRDAHFTEVLRRCAQPRSADDGVWITPRLQRLYESLHALGVAHSIEIHDGERPLAGLIAVVLGRAAMLESMAHWRPHAGNVLLARTLDDLAARGIELCDIQLPTPHTMRLGARLVGRTEYEARLRRALS